MKLPWLVALLVLSLWTVELWAQDESPAASEAVPAMEDYAETADPPLDDEHREPSFTWETARDFGGKSPLIIIWMVLIVVAFYHALNGRMALGFCLGAAALLHLISLPVEIIFENYIYYSIEYSIEDIDIFENAEMYLCVVDVILSIFRSVAWVLLMIAMGIAVRTTPPQR